MGPQHGAHEREELWKVHGKVPHLEAPWQGYMHPQFRREKLPLGAPYIWPLVGILDGLADKPF